MADDGTSQETAPAWRRTLTRSLFLSGGLILLVALLSLLALVYLSWSSSLRLDPLEKHLNHLRNLQTVNLEIQGALVNEIRHTDRPDRETVEQISIDLRNMLRQDGYLHHSTPARILKAQNYLLRDGYSLQDNLAAAFTVMQETLRDENQVQRQVIAQSRRNADREFMIAVFALIVMPLIVLALLLFFRHRLFAWSASLAEMLENVRQSNLAPVHLPPPGDTIYPVIERYNAMVERLREIEREHVGKQQELEHEVQVATNSLLRVQRSLSQAEQLSAIGEFSARIAHELRNPLSGITEALRNLKRDERDAEKAELIDLVLAELERISRLLDSLLARTPREKERFVPTRVAELCRNMTTLLEYETDTTVRVTIALPDCECELPRDSLRQAVLNILRNSAQAMGKNGGEIRIGGHVADGRLTLAFEDDGPGYPEDILRNGIRPFRSDRHGGSGLGLSILQRLVATMGGALRIERAASGGARTVIELPCKGGADD